MIPIPPSCASAIASAASVTVSIGEETNGIFTSILPGKPGMRVGLGWDEIAAGGNQQHVIKRDRIVNDLGVFHVIIIGSKHEDVKLVLAACGFADQPTWK